MNKEQMMVVVNCWDIGEKKESCRLNIMEYGISLLESNEIFKCIDWIQQILSIKYGDRTFKIQFKHDLLKQLSKRVA